MILFSRFNVLLLLLSAAVSVVPFAANAGGTRVWELAGSSELDQGETDGTLVSSEGEVSLGYKERKLNLKDVGVVWSAVSDSRGTVYLGTGYDGKIFRVKGNRVDEIATTGQLVVTSLALDKKGNLFAATLPDPILWKVDGPGKIDGKKPVVANEWAKLEDGVEHIFALGFGSDGKTLYAGTGPEGKLFAVGPDKKPSLYLDTEEEHLLSIATYKGGILVGTSPGAMLLQVSGPGRASALADFDGTEVKALVVQKSDIYVAVNKFKTPPAIPTKPTTETDAVNGNSSDKKTPAKNKGESTLYRVAVDGKLEELYSHKESHIVSLAGSKDGDIYIGFGFEGKVLVIDQERVIRTVLDVDERQVTALVVNNDLELAATGDAGAVYSIARASKADALYYSPPLDAKAVSSWGRLTWYASGKADSHY